MDAIALLREELATMLADSSLPPAVSTEPMHAPVDVSPRGIKMTEIIRIADQYNWHKAITHFLQTKGRPYISDLNEPQLDDLLDRMHGYVDAAEMGCSLPDCPPAN
jgi:hypothetical protein